MKLHLFLVLVFSLLSVENFAASFGKPSGYWQLSNNQGKPQIVISIKEKENVLNAIILDYYPNKSARCVKCSGTLKDAPFRKFPIMSGLIKTSDNVWSSGKLLDPTTGKIHDIELTLLNNGRAIKITYTGLLSLFSTYDIWTRRN